MRWLANYSFGNAVVRVAMLMGFSTTVLGQANTALQEVTVIAKKRQQVSSRVDISLNALNPDALQALHVNTLTDSAALVENVALFEDFSGAGIPTWVIRGVGLQDYNSNNTPTAAIYMDGAYQVATVMGGAALFDVSNLEILKGPQGGLYGRNTSGGAVLLNSNRAALNEDQATIKLGYGSWSRSQVQAVLNQPLGSNTAIRLAINAEAGGDAWQDSLSARGTQGDTDKLDLRSWLRHDFSDNFRIEWKLQAGRDNSDIPLGRSIGVYDPSGTGDFCAAVLAGRRDDSNCINFAGVNRVVFGTGAPEIISSQSDDGRLVLSDMINRQSNDYLSSVLELYWTFDELTLLSLTALDSYHYGVGLDLDASFGEYGHRFSSSDIETWAQEFRLISPADKAISWLAGVSISGEQFDESRDFKLQANRLVGLGHGKLAYEQTTDSVSAYADIEAQLSRSWQLGASVRYTDEDKAYRNGNFWIPATTPIYLTRDLSADYRLSSHLAGSVSLQWQPNDDSFLYLKYSSGFKSGGFFGGFPFNPAEIEPYKEETINAWEAGLKWQLPPAGLAINLAVFRYNYQDVQGFIRDINPQTGTGIDRLANQGDAIHKGAEVQLVWQASSQLDLELGLGWLDARFVESGIQTLNLAGELVNIRGDRPWAPDFNGNLLLRYTLPEFAGKRLEVTGSYDYRSEFSGYQSSLVDQAINYLPGYGLLNLAANLTAPGAPWSLGLWLRNAANTSYVNRVKNDGLNSYMELFGEPRSGGITIEYRL